jgi:hypothetical protein
MLNVEPIKNLFCILIFKLIQAIRFDFIGLLNIRTCLESHPLNEKSDQISTCSLLLIDEIRLFNGKKRHWSFFK